MKEDQPPSPVTPPWMEEIDQQIDDLVNAAPPILSKPFEDVCEFIENRSLTFKLFRNAYSHSAFFPSHKGGKRKQPSHALKPEQRKRNGATYFVPLPLNRSMFTVSEMNDLYAVYTASHTTESPTSSQILTYSNSLAKIQAENGEYLHHIKRHWLEESWARVNVIEEEVTLFVSIWWEARINRVRNYAEVYSRLSPVPLTPMEMEGKLVFLKTIKKYGTPSRYYSSSYRQNPCSLSIVQEELLKIERDRVRQRKSSVTDTNKEVSDDNMARNFAVDHQAQVVTTPSVLAAIVANTPGTFEEAWCIPFQIKEFDSGDQSRKIIFMDKKLPPKALTISQKNAIFAKMASRAIFRKSKNSLAAVYSKDADQNHKGDDEYEDEKKDDDEYKDEKKDDDEYKDEKKDEEKKEEEYGVLGSTHNRGMREEVSYDLWAYSVAEEHSVLSKHHRKPFKILLKTTTKGKNFDSKKSLLPCVMTSKLEYQPEYGASVMSFKDLMREWISLKLRPDSFMHRVRVDPIKGDIVMLEFKTDTAIANDCQRLHSRCVHRQLSIIQNLFDHLSPLPPGNYLLNHDPKDKGFMYVYHELQDKRKRTVTNLNIWEDYSQIDTSSHAEQLAPWIPIDTTIMTPTLHCLKRIPCVFPPARDAANKRKLAEEMSMKRGSHKFSQKKPQTTAVGITQKNSGTVKKKPKKNKRKRNAKKSLPKTRVSEKSTKEKSKEKTRPRAESSRELVSYCGVFGE